MSETKQSSSEKASPTARYLDEFQLPPTNDPQELIATRFLCRGGGMILSGATGIGKSSLDMQFAVSWALGLTCFGLAPKRPSKSVIIQAENDEGDLVEFREGIFDGLELSKEQRQQACRQILIYDECDKTGHEFGTLASALLEKYRPDLLHIDPALAYLGGDAKNQTDVGTFLRHDIGPAIKRQAAGSVTLHHTNKPNGSGQYLGAYSGSGSIEWGNWSRAVLTLREVPGTKPVVYELQAPKRGQRLHWPSPYKYIVQDPSKIFWREVPAPTSVDGNGKPRSSNSLKAEKRRRQLLELLPPDGLTFTQWFSRAKDRWGISRSAFDRHREDLEEGYWIENLDNKWTPNKLEPTFRHK